MLYERKVALKAIDGASNINKAVNSGRKGGKYAEIEKVFESERERVMKKAVEDAK